MIPTTGEWAVTTASGSRYAVDFDAMVVSRLPGAGANELRRDEDTIPLIEILVMQVGWPMELVLDIVGDGDTLTYRRTTPVEELLQIA